MNETDWVKNAAEQQQQKNYNNKSNQKSEWKHSSHFWDKLKEQRFGECLVKNYIVLP